MRQRSRERAYWMAYGDRLRLVRAVLGITEAQAAEAHGVTVQTYKRWEAGGPQRGAGPAIDFAETYDVSLDWLIGGRASLLKKHLSFNPGGKLAILPVTIPDWRQAHNRLSGSGPRAA